MTKEKTNKVVNTLFRGLVATMDYFADATTLYAEANTSFNTSAVKAEFAKL